MEFHLNMVLGPEPKTVVSVPLKTAKVWVGIDEDGNEINQLIKQAFDHEVSGEIVKENRHTVQVRLPDGNIIMRHRAKHLGSLAPSADFLKQKEDLWRTRS